MGGKETRTCCVALREKEMPPIQAGGRGEVTLDFEGRWGHGSARVRGAKLVPRTSSMLVCSKKSGSVTHIGQGWGGGVHHYGRRAQNGRGGKESEKYTQLIKAKWKGQSGLREMKKGGPRPGERLQRISVVSEKKRGKRDGRGITTL